MKKGLSVVLVITIIVTMISGLTITAHASGISNYVWIEAESGNPDKGVGFGSIQGTVGTTYQTLSGQKALRVKDGTNTGIGINFDFSVDRAQSYDIFVHGTYEENSAYMSTISMYVDGTASEITNLGAEGWIIKGSSNYNFQVGWQKVTKTLSSGNHTFRWQIDGKGSNASSNKALCDVIVVVPTRAGYVPALLETVDSLFPVKNAMNYELCTLLTEYDLTNVDEDLTMPETTAGGYAVTWSTSNADIIGKDGKIAKAEDDQIATLTATIAVDGVTYTKDFTVTVTEDTSAGPVVPEEPDVPEIPCEPSEDCIWIEGENGTKDSGSSFGTISGNEGTTYDSISSRKAFRIKDGTAKGIGINYNFSVGKTQSYDIFVRGSYEFESDYMSQISMHVDGTKTEFTDLGSEGWIIQGSSGYNFQIGWQKITTQLVAGNHSFRWQIDDKGVKASGNKGILDVIIIVPSHLRYGPTMIETVDSQFPVKNVIDYELCTLLSNYDLTAVENDLTLPTVTAKGYVVRWKSSNEDIIDVNGKINLTGTAQTATLTATIINDGVGYTKDFEITVCKAEFKAVATVNNDKVTITYSCPESVEEIPYNVFVASFKGEESNELCRFSCEGSGVFAKGTRGDIGPFSLHYADGVTKSVVFLWKKDLTPLMTEVAVEFAGEFIVTPAGEVAELHDTNLARYLDDSYENIANYVVSGERNDRPLPVTFEWYHVDTEFIADKYVVAIGENPDMLDAMVFETTERSYSLYNLKAGQDYYWTVTAKNGNEEKKSEIATFTTSDVPRNILVNGVRNVRDVGGWLTEDGAKVKQGLVYRSARLDSISEEGIRILHDDIKIKTEIDLRRDEDEPVYGDRSPIGDDVQYFRFPMEYGDYLTTNVQSIKSVFEILADESNYPIIYHCSAGADRTGVITYLINGLLGVEQEDLFRDYLLTNFGGSTRDMSYITGVYVKTLDEYDNGNGTLQERIYKYINEEIGVSADKLDAVIRNLK